MIHAALATREPIPSLHLHGGTSSRARFAPWLPLHRWPTSDNLVSWALHLAARRGRGTSRESTVNSNGATRGGRGTRPIERVVEVVDVAAGERRVARNQGLARCGRASVHRATTREPRQRRERRQGPSSGNKKNPAARAIWTCVEPKRLLAAFMRGFQQRQHKPNNSRHEL
ncbi:unnamed protein product [Lampetra planeri]